MLLLVTTAVREEDVLSGGVDLGNVEAGKVLDALYHVVVHGLGHLGDRTSIGHQCRQVYGRLRLADLHEKRARVPLHRQRPV